ARASGALFSTERARAISNLRWTTRPQPPIDVRRVGPNRRKSGELAVVGREMAHGIGCASVTGEREGLAAAAAEIHPATRPASAWLLHPRAAAKGIEGRRVRPDVGERMLAHVPESKAGDRLGGMTRQHLPGRRHVQRTPAPTADARLRVAGIVVRNHRIDDDATMLARA